MKSGKWSTVVDYFLILGSIIGVGFASGKEIFVFFFRFGSCSLLGLLAFGLIYIFLFLIVQYVNCKLKINSYNEFNKKIFGRFAIVSQYVLLVNFIITSAGMLAGADYILSAFLGINFRFATIGLTIILFFTLLGGIKKIKMIANIIIPFMLAVIVLNSIKNITPTNVNFPIVKSNGVVAIYYGLLFALNNFVTAFPILFETKLKSKGKIFVTCTVCLVILLNILVFASNNFSSSMPMLELAKNVSNSFYWIYLMTLLLAIFSTLEICSFNSVCILSKGKKSIFWIFVVILSNVIVSNFGYDFIVSYLYVVSGIISSCYVLFMLIFMLCQSIKRKKKH